MPTVYLIDASPYIFRAYFSLPTTIESPDGRQVNAVYGFTQFLIQIINLEPTHVGVAFDGSLTTSFRNEIYPDYKAQRALPPPELEAQIDDCFQVTEALGLATFIDDKFEADDIIATWVARLQEVEIVVISQDKDLTNLVNEKVTFWDFAKDTLFDAEKVKQKFGVRPEQIPDLLALVGDSVDNIPGVKGIGKKTAIKLLAEFDSLEALYENLDRIPMLNIRAPGAIKETLIEQKETADLSKQLATLATEAPIEGGLDRLAYHGPERNDLIRKFDELGFEKLRERLS